MDQNGTEGKLWFLELVTSTPLTWHWGGFSSSPCVFTYDFVTSSFSLTLIYSHEECPFICQMRHVRGIVKWKLLSGWWPEIGSHRGGGAAVGHNKAINIHENRLAIKSSISLFRRFSAADFLSLWKFPPLRRHRTTHCPPPHSLAVHHSLNSISARPGWIFAKQQKPGS